MSTNFLKPSSAGIRQPTDDSKVNGQIINPPRYAEMGGLSGPSKISGVSNTKADTGNHFTISKPNGGRG